MSKKKKEQKKEAEVNDSPHLNSALLITIAALSGCLVMVIELTSSRLLAPYYGNTIYCWTGVIGTILFALSLGYFVGGILADKYDHRPLLIILLTCSSFTTAIIPFIANAFAEFLATKSSTSGPIIGSFVIFALPAFFLSTLPPLCVKLVSENFKLVGLASGTVSSTSAIGSIFGTFVTGFYLIPNFNLSQIYYFSALVPLVLLMLVMLNYHKISKVKNAIAITVMIVIATICWQGYKQIDVFPSLEKEEYKKLTPYHLIRVYDRGDHYSLHLDTTSEGAIAKSYNPDDPEDTNEPLIYGYTKYWKLIQCFKEKKEINRACFVGGGAFAMPTVFSKKFSTTKIDAIEIDPELVPVGIKFFQLRPEIVQIEGEYFKMKDYGSPELIKVKNPQSILENAKMRVHIEDGRSWFRGKKDYYDFIFLDAFHGVRSIPYHLVTEEYFGELATALTAKGIISLNVIAAYEGEQALFFRSLLKGIAKHFEHIFIFSTNPKQLKKSNNLILFALKSKDYDAKKMERKAKQLKIYKKYYKKMVGPPLTKADVEKDLREVFALSDLYAPVEYLVAQQE